ncbi:MAG: vWA domain-containing protein [Polyangiaceae bacterium]
MIRFGWFSSASVAWWVGSAAALAVISGCQALEFDSTDSGTNGDGAGGVTPVLGGGGGGSQGPEANEVEEFVVADVNAGSLVAPVCSTTAADPDRFVATPVSHAGYASAEYAKGLLTLTQPVWPDPTVIRLDDFLNYFGDRLPNGLSQTPLPDGAGLELSVHLASLDKVAEGVPGDQPGLSTRLSFRARLPVTATTRQPTELILLVDVSPSNDRIGGLRAALLRQLAAAMQTGAFSSGDTLTLITFAADTQVVFENETAADLDSKISEALASGALYQRTGNDLVLGLTRALEEARASSTAAHVMVITDGGILPSDGLAATVEAAHESGVPVSATQLGEPGNPFLADALLQTIVGTTGGARLYFTNEAEIDLALTNQYESIIPVATANARMELGLPLGVSLPDVQRVDPIDPAIVRRTGLGFGRAFSGEVVVDGCANVVDPTHLSEDLFTLTLFDGDASIATNAKTRLEALAGPSAAESAITAVVQALRTRATPDLQLAFDRLVALAPNCVVNTSTCDDNTPADCCVRRELESMLHGVCKLVEVGANLPQACANQFGP